MPETIGNYYLLLETPARLGGHAVVRKAIDFRDGSEVAVKFMASPTDDLDQRIFDRECRALKDLDHPNVVTFRDSGRDDTGRLYIVLDWVEQTLSKLLAEPPWTTWLELYEQIIGPISDALAYAHLRGREHRDIKPGNIMVHQSGAPLLADFGISKVRDESIDAEPTLRQFGSGAYAPPERNGAVPYVRDVYSIGILMLDCLSKSRLRDFSDVKPALESVDVPPDVLDLITRCVSPDASERPSNGSELALQLRILAAADGESKTQSLPVWIDLTERVAQNMSVTRGQAVASVQQDLSGDTYAEFGIDWKTGSRQADVILLYGNERRYTLKPKAATGRFVITAADELEIEKLDSGRAHGLQLPARIAWRTTAALSPAQAHVTQREFTELISQWYSRKDLVESDDDARTSELFDRWLRILDAREDLARGSHPPLAFTSIIRTGKKAILTLREVTESNLLGTDWEIVEAQTGRKTGHGEIIDQGETQLTLLSTKDFRSGSKTGTVVPFDRPSAVSLSRQRDAVLAVKAATNPNPRLVRLLADPTLNESPRNEVIEGWSDDLDETKRRAVEAALGATDVLLVQGPPGTGKTRFITEAVSRFLERNPTGKVLIASQTHVAVDNAVDRLNAAGVRGLVRLAGLDTSAVQESVRHLLLETQTQRWSAIVRKRAEAESLRQMAAAGVEPAHFLAAIALKQFVAVSEELSVIESGLREMQRLGVDEPTDLEAVTESTRAVDDLQSRIDQLADRRAELLSSAKSQIGSDLTLSDRLESPEAEHAISVLLGDIGIESSLLAQLELQAAWLEEIQSETSLSSMFLAGISVVAGTCTGFLRNRSITDVEFDLCIVDEASKATLTEVLVPLSRSKRWILVGDTRQLPPSDEELIRDHERLQEYGITASEVEETLFQRFADHLPAHSNLMLNEQYRMIRPIGDLISNCFYDGQLRSPRTTGIAGYDAVCGRAVTWMDTSSLGDRRRESGTSSFANRAESEVLIKRLETINSAARMGLLSSPSGEPLEVLVIAPYKSQVEELGRRLAPKDFRELNISVLSVDAVQGREADLALFSITRSNANARLGFLGQDYWRRINVALSRARYGLTIVGDAGFVRGTDGALRQVLDYIDANPTDCAIQVVGNE